MSTSNQQTLAELGSFKRPPMLEKGWASHFMSFLEEGERIHQSDKLSSSRNTNDIYNFVDACKTSNQMWERIRRLMHAFDKTKQQRHSRLVDEFDKFVANANIKEIEFDHFFDTLSQYKPHVIASRAKKAASNHHLLALVVHSNVHSSHSHASLSYSHSPQSYYVTHPLLIIDYEEDYQEELNATLIMMAHIQPTNDKADAELIYDADAFSEGKYLGKIIFDDPYVNNNCRNDEHYSNAYYQSVALESLIQNVQKEAKNQRSLNNELKKQKALLQKELEMCKQRVKTLEKQPVKSLNYKEAYEELEREIRVDKDKIDNLINEKDKIQDELFQLEIASSREEMEEEDQEVLKSINENPAQKAAKRRKLNKEAQKLKILRSISREDLKNLWGIVKERFSTSKPSNISDEYLLTTLKIMFEKLDRQDAVWKSQRSVHGLELVKMWKLLTSCGVHIISLTTIQLILLVERRYPLSKFTLEQLLLELMLSKRSRKNTKCVNAVDEELTAAKHKLMMVTIQPVQRRQSSFAAGTSRTRDNISGPKRKKDAIWFRDKVLLVKAQGSSKVLNEKELEFLTDLGVEEGRPRLFL
nr:hypothetical protein [Tanacetum cinerariifolium]